MSDQLTRRAALVLVLSLPLRPDDQARWLALDLSSVEGVRINYGNETKEITAEEIWEALK